MTSSPMLSPQEIADLLAVDVKKVRKWIKRHELKGAVNVALSTRKRKQLRVPKEEVEAFLNRRMEHPVHKPARAKRKTADYPSDRLTF